MLWIKKLQGPDAEEMMKKQSKLNKDYAAKLKATRFAEKMKIKQLDRNAMLRKFRNDYDVEEYKEIQELTKRIKKKPNHDDLESLIEKRQWRF